MTAPDKAEPKIVSVTISNNASSIIGEAIASVVEQVDLVVLVDTGITDGTVERARAAAGNKLRVCRHVWKDFSSARNASLGFAREYGATHAVVVDTDERFYWHGLDLRKAIAKSSSDIFSIRSADGVYPKEKIIRLDSPVVYFGPTHEVPINKRSDELLPTVRFDELGKTLQQMEQKWLRDASVLADWLNIPEHANDARWWYYLGDALQGLRRHDAAIRAFGRCVELRKPISEEGGWAAYRQAQCLCETNRPREAVEVCAWGMSRYPSGELAWLAAYACAHSGWTSEAIRWAYLSVALGNFAGHPGTRSIFTYPPALYEKPFEVLKALLPEGLDRTKAEADYKSSLIKRLGADDEQGMDVMSVRRCQQREELRALLRPTGIRKLLKNTKAFTLELTKESLAVAGKVGQYHAMNPSVVVHEGELWVLIRMVNYTIENGQYVIADLDGMVRTANLLGKLLLKDNEVAISDVTLLQDNDTGERFPTLVRGYEDVRLFSVKGKLYGSATVRDRGQDRCKIALLDIDIDGGAVAKATVQETDRWTEKNWMPIVADDPSTAEIRWVYEISPTAVRQADGHMEVRACPSDLSLEHLRGSSHVISFDEGYLCVSHETISQSGWGVRRIYLHRFVRFDKKMRVVAVSPTWTFEDGHHGIEFCSSLCRDPNTRDRLLLGYGFEDRQAKILVVKDSEVRALKWIESEIKRPEQPVAAASEVSVEAAADTRAGADIPVRDGERAEQETAAS